MDMFLKKKKRQPTALNLIAIMNIFAVLIIFFIKANVIGETAVEIPDDLHIPKSISTETVDTAPEVFVYADAVDFKLIKRKVGYSDIRVVNGKLTQKGEFLSREIKGFIGRLSKQAKEFGLVVNLVADSSVPYKNVYEVVRFLKLAGFQYVLFIAEVEDSEK